MKLVKNQGFTLIELMIVVALVAVLAVIALPNFRDLILKSRRSDAIDALLAYTWPGNVRELQNIIRSAVVLHDGKELTADMLSLSGANTQRLYCEVPGKYRGPSTGDSDESKIDVRIDQPFDVIERTIIEAAIAQCNGSIPRAAEILKLSPSTIYRKKENWK